MRYLKLREVRSTLKVDDALVHTLAEEGLIEIKHTLDDELVISLDHAERLRVGALLIREMEVNLAGVEIILRMREDLVGMQRQFYEVLQTLASEFRKQLDR